MTLLVLPNQRLRRDRWQLLVWILGLGALALLAAVGVAQAYGDPAERQSTIELAVANPAILLLRGLPNGSDLGAFVFFQIFTYFALGAGFMSTFLAVRHSRAEEETGRAELIGSTPASRILPTVATVIHGVLANLAVGVLVALGFIGGGLGVTGSWVTGAATAAVGVSFLGIGLLVPSSCAPHVARTERLRPSWAWRFCFAALATRWELPRRTPNPRRAHGRAGSRRSAGPSTLRRSTRTISPRCC